MTSDYFVVKRGATALPNAVIHDPDLSKDALVLLLIMLTLPPGTPMGYRDLMGRGHGETVTRRAMAELESRGLRWRMLVRRDGKLRTITMVYDEPTDEAQAVEDAERATGLAVISCASKAADRQQNPLSHCAEVSTAQNDKDKHCDTSAEAPVSETPSRTVQRFPRPRKQRPRRPVAEKSQAQPSNDGSNGWVTDVTQPNQTQPAREPAPPVSELDPDGDGRAGSGLVGLLDQQGEGIADQDWDVLVECLPPRMRRIEPSATAAVAAALRKRVEAGWSPDALRATLAGNSLPPDSEIRNLAGIVSHRIGQVPVRPPQRRKQPPTQSRSAQVKPATVPLALQKRAEAREMGSPDANQPLSWWFEKYPTGGVGAGESA